MPDITVRHELNTDEATYWGKVVFQDDFNTKLFVEHLGIGWELVSQKEDDAKLTRRVNVEPPIGNLPAVLKRMLSDKLSYVEEGTFDKRARRYAFEITPSLRPETTKVTGEVWLEKLGEKKVVRFCRISVAVKILMVGSMIEDRIVTQLTSSYDRAAQFANDYIAKNNL